MANEKNEPKQTVVMATSLAGPNFAVHKGDDYECGVAEAKRLIDRGFAKAKAPEAAG